MKTNNQAPLSTGEGLGVRLALLLLCLLFTACGSKTSEQQEAGTAEYGAYDFKVLTQEKLPQKVDLSVDFSDCQLQELVLLRNYVYAVHGCYFLEKEVERFFEQRTTWYWDLVQNMCEEQDVVLSYSTTPLTPEEQDFVTRIDQRIAELRAAATDPQTGLTHAWAIRTLWQFEDISQEFIDHLEQDNFVITPSGYDQLFNVYEENDYREVGSFVTTDVALQLFHMYFAYTQKSIEKHVLRDRLVKLCDAMVQTTWPHDWDQYSFYGDEQLEDLGRYTMAYFYIPLRLLGSDAPFMSQAYDEEVKQELANIRAQKADISPLLGGKTLFPYDQFKPRGYYDREDWSRSYFQAMQWLQLAGLNYNDDESLRRALFMASWLNANAEVGDAYEAVDRIVTLIMGEKDNVSMTELAEFVRSKGWSLQTAVSDAAVAEARTFVTAQSKAHNRIHSKLENPADSVVNFMPARYTADGEVLAQMADEKLNAKRAFPRGLDVLAAFGVAEADSLLTGFHHDDKAWSKFGETLKGLKNERTAWTRREGDKCIYNKWLATLVELASNDYDVQVHKQQMPQVMNTKAWSHKTLNSTLAAWAELKHDAILYAEQPMLAECGDGSCLPSPHVKGYVEPNVPFWEAMMKMCDYMRKELTKCNALTDDLNSKLEDMEHLLDFCLNVSRKELRGQELPEEDYWQIERIGSWLEWLTLEMIYPDVMLSDWNDVQGADRSVACVADVFTRNITDCKHCGILHVATSRPYTIYVMVPIAGYTYLMRGAVLGYREFVEPLDSRLTDEEWQKRLEEKPRYGEPEWLSPIIIDNEPKVDESIFYSSGC